MRKINKKGFTLVEVVVVMSIIAVLALLTVGAIKSARFTSRTTTHITNAKILQAGMKAYFAKHKIYPPATEGDTGPNGWDSYPFDMLAEQLNVTLTPTSECHNENGWADGGGQVWIQTGSRHYTISPYDGDCHDTEDMLSSRIIQ
jgi:prepilin-type N-terminal cleavage/methylation domain-containing protein